eukprot:403371089
MDPVKGVDKTKLQIQVLDLKQKYLTFIEKKKEQQIQQKEQLLASTRSNTVIQQSKQSQSKTSSPLMTQRKKQSIEISSLNQASSMTLNQKYPLTQISQSARIKKQLESKSKVEGKQKANDQSSLIHNLKSLNSQEFLSTQRQPSSNNMKMSLNSNDFRMQSLNFGILDNHLLNHESSGHFPKAKSNFLSKICSRFNQQVKAFNPQDENKEIFIESIEIFRQAALKSFKNKYKKGSVDAINMIIRACLIIPDVFLLKSSLKLLGFLYIFLNKMKFAVSCFEKLRDVADEDQDFISVMFAYKQLGLCFQKVQEYDRAIVCFKSMLQFAWKENNVEFEMQAYDFLGLQYYYLGQLDNAKYYHERMVRGKFESKKSNLRRLSEEQYKKKELAKDDRHMKFEQHVEFDQTTGREVIITREAKDFSLAKEIKEQSLLFMERINDDLDMIIQNKGAVPMMLKKVNEPAKLYQSTQQDEQFQDLIQNNNPNSLMRATSQLRQAQSQTLFSHPKIYIRQGTSIFEKTDKELPSPKDVNSKGKNVQLLPHFLQEEDSEEEVDLDQETQNQTQTVQSNKQQNEKQQISKTQAAGFMTQRTLISTNKDNQIKDGQQNNNHKRTQSTDHVNHEPSKKIANDIETFQSIRLASKLNLTKNFSKKRGVYTDYFAQIREVRNYEFLCLIEQSMEEKNGYRSQRAI